MFLSRIVSSNVRGLKHHSMDAKVKGLMVNLLDLDADFYCLVDTHLNSDSEYRLSSLWNGEIFYAHGPNSRNGIAVLNRNAQISDFYGHESGRFSIFRAKLGNRNLLCCVIYAPANSPTERSPFFNLIQTKIQCMLKPEEEIILLGDFNCVESCELDRLNAKYPDPSVRSLKSLNASLDLFDTFRHCKPSEISFTFVSSRGNASRLDRAYASSYLLDFLTLVDHPPNVYSDHTFLTVDFDFSEVEIGKGQWRLPSNVLQDKSFQDNIENFWSGWTNQKRMFPSLLEWWDKGKERIKSIALTHQKRFRKRENRHLKSLDKRLRNAIKGGKIGLINHLNTQIRSVHRDRVSQYFQSRKLDWAEYWEKST